MREGDTADDICFIAKGLLRTYDYDETGKGITKFFFAPNQFVTNLDSYLNAVPSWFYMEALTPCTLLCIRKQNTLQLTGWPYLFNHLVQQTLLQKVATQQSLQHLQGKEK